MKIFSPDNISSQRWTPYSVTWGQLGRFLEEIPQESSNARYLFSIFVSNSSSFFILASWRSLKQHRIHSLFKMIRYIVFEPFLGYFHLFHLCKESVLKNPWCSFVLLKNKQFKGFHAFLSKTFRCLQLQIEIKSEIDDTNKQYKLHWSQPHLGRPQSWRHSRLLWFEAPPEKWFTKATWNVETLSKKEMAAWAEGMSRRTQEQETSSRLSLPCTDQDTSFSHN